MCPAQYLYPEWRGYRGIPRAGRPNEDQVLNPVNIAENDADGAIKRINITNLLSN